VLVVLPPVAFSAILPELSTEMITLGAGSLPPVPGGAFGNVNCCEYAAGMQVKKQAIAMVLALKRLCCVCVVVAEKNIDSDFDFFIVVRPINGVALNENRF
jgi:hypothetical protein